MEFMVHHFHWGMTFGEAVEEAGEALTDHTGMDGRVLLAIGIVIVGLLVFRRAFR